MLVCIYRVGGKRLKDSLMWLWKGMKRNDGFGMSEILGIAAVLVVAAFVLIPGFSDFADLVIDRMTAWFSATIDTRIFPTTNP